LVALSLHNVHPSLLGLYTVIFLAGIARGFADPANTAFEAQVVPKTLTVNASSWIGSTWVACGVLGPAVIGFVFDAWQAAGAYALIAVFFIFSCLCTLAIAPKTQSLPQEKEPIIKSITVGWKFVFGNQALFGAMALDLFAVLFGGAVALLPIYANDILHVGAKGLGLLNAASSMGALITMLVATRHAPATIANAGRNLMLTIVGFGISIILFAFSKNFLLSMSALFVSGIFDGISMVIRRSMVRLLSPDHMRGRISAVSWIFICSSNELGAFESGMIAAWIGAVPCVAAGGFVTLAVVGLTAILAPQLRNLRFDPMTLERKFT
jgi:MFS family permease